MRSFFIILLVVTGGYYVYTHPAIIEFSSLKSAIPGISTAKKEVIVEKTKEQTKDQFDAAKEYVAQKQDEAQSLGEKLVHGARVEIYDRVAQTAATTLSAVAKSLGLSQTTSTPSSTVQQMQSKTPESSPKPTGAPTQQIIIGEEKNTPLTVCNFQSRQEKIKFGIQIAKGETGQYATAIDWGDGTQAPAQLISETQKTIEHEYKNTGTYTITVEAGNGTKEYRMYKIVCIE